MITWISSCLRRFRIDSDEGEDIALSRAQRYAEIRKQTKLLDSAITDNAAMFPELLMEIKLIVNRVLQGQLPLCSNQQLPSITHNAPVPSMPESDSLQSMTVLPPSTEDVPAADACSQNLPDITIQNVATRGRPKRRKTLLSFNNTQKSQAAAKTNALDINNLEDEGGLPRRSTRKRLSSISESTVSAEQNEEVTETTTIKITCDCGNIKAHTYAAFYPPPEVGVEEVNPETNVALPPKTTESPADGIIYWIKDLELLSRELHLLQTGGLINAYHISAAMFLLKQYAASENKRFGGMDYQQRLQTDPTISTFVTEERALQIVYTPGHWQLITRMLTKVSFYCSLDFDITDETQRVIGHFLRLKEGESIEIHRRRNQMQKGVDCGLHVIAMATAFVFGQDISSTTFDDRSLRNHLYNCYVNHSMVPFPRARRDQEVIFTKESVVQIIIPRLWHKKQYVTEKVKRPKRTAPNAL